MDPLDQLIDDNVQQTVAYGVPRYFPVHQQLIGQLSSCRFEDSTSKLKELQKDLVKMAKDYTDLQMEGADNIEAKKNELLTNDETLKHSMELLNNMRNLAGNNHRINSAVTKTKAEIHRRYREEEKLSFATLPMYQQISSESEDATMESADLLKYYLSISRARAPRNDNIEVDATDDLTIYIDPYAVVKDKNENDEDELEISGGRVELACPLSRQIMHEPVITENCRHTMDKDSLREYMQNHSQRSEAPCPVCGKPMGPRKEDKVMKLRLAAYRRYEEAAKYR